jgi:GNAT superfamily N-acetyltransferase
MVLIRSASAADAAAVSAVQRASWLAAYRDIIEMPLLERAVPPDDGARVRQSFRVRPWQRMIVAVDDTPGAGSRIVGYAAYGPELEVFGAPWPHPVSEAGAAGKVGELYALYVDPGWWSTGAGRALITRVLERLAAYPVITLWVLERNARARRFYACAGFAPDGAANMLDALGGVTEIRYRRDSSIP